MADELIEDLANIPRLEEQRKQVVAGLREVRDLIIEVNKLSRGSSFGAGSSFSGSEGARKAVDELAKAEARLAKSSTDLAKQVATLNVQTAENNKQNKAAAKESLGLVDAYMKLNKQYQEASRNAKNLAVVHGVESKQAKDAAAQAMNLHKQLTAIDNSVGQYQRNVGNYTSATFALSQILREAPAFAFNLQTGLLAISNNMPVLFDEFNKLSKAIDQNTQKQIGAVGALGTLAKSLFSWTNILTIGISLLTLFGPKIADWITSLFSAASATDELRKRQDELNKSMDDAVKSTFDETVAARRLFNIATDVTASTIQRKEAVKQLRELYPSYLKDFSDETIMAGQANAAYTKLVGSLQAVAKNKAIMNQVSKNMETDLDLEKQRARVQLELDALLDKAKKETPTLLKWSREKGTYLKGEYAIVQRLAEIDEKRALIASENIVLERKVAEDKTDIDAAAAKAAAEAAKKAAEAAKKAAEERRKLNEESAKGAIKAQLTELEAGAIIQKQIFENEKLSYEERINALDAFDLYQSAIARMRRELEIKEAKDNNGQKLLAEENFRKANIEAEIAYGEEYLKIQADYLDKQTAAILNQGKKNAAALEQAQAVEEEKLLSLRQQGLVTEDEYNAESLRIKNKYDILRLQSELDTTKKIIALRKARGEDVSKEEAAVADIEAQIKASEVAYFKSAEDLKNAILKKASKARIKELTEEQKQAREIIVKTIETINQFGKAFLDIISGTYERQKNAIQDQIDGIKEREEAQIEAVNKEQISEQEKADKIAVIQATTRAREQALEREKRRIANEQARFDKAKAMFDAVAGTAVAIVKALPNPILIALAAAMGAAQIAAIASQPLPRYKDGRKGGAAEFAYVGDGGVSEVIEHNGRAYVTPSRPTVAYLPEGATVHKSVAEYRKALAAEQANAPVMGVQYSIDNSGRLVDAIAAGNDRVVSAIKGAQPVIVVDSDAYIAGVRARKVAARNNRIIKGYVK